MSIDELAAMALRLPLRERVMLAAALWESLADPFELSTTDDDSADIALAVERDRQLESGEALPLSHEELMARLR